MVIINQLVENKHERSGQLNRSFCLYRSINNYLIGGRQELIKIVFLNGFLFGDPLYE